MIITSSTSFPTHDSNHACLLRATADRAGDLIAEVSGYFQEKALPVAFYISPACTPSDLPERLVDRGFCRQPEQEAWMVLQDLPDFDLPSPYPGITVKPISKGETITFSQVFLAAFGLPTDLAPILAQIMEPSVELPDVHHYLACKGDLPVGTCSLLRWEAFGILGSTGVIPDQQRAGTATTLAVRALTDARDHGVETVMLQTYADTWLERMLRASGFKRAFARSCYVLDDGYSGRD